MPSSPAATSASLDESCRVGLRALPSALLDALPRLARPRARPVPRASGRRTRSSTSASSARPVSSADSAASTPALAKTVPMASSSTRPARAAASSAPRVAPASHACSAELARTAPTAAPRCAPSALLASSGQSWAPHVYPGVKSHAACCNLCSSQPQCESWQWGTDGVCKLMSGLPKYLGKSAQQALGIFNKNVRYFSGPNALFGETCDVSGVSTNLAGYTISP